MALKMDHTLEMKVCIYRDETKEIIAENKNYLFVPDLESASNFFKQGYQHFKTLSEYANAVDC